MKSDCSHCFGVGCYWCPGSGADRHRNATKQAEEKLSRLPEAVKADVLILMDETKSNEDRDAAGERALEALKGDTHITLWCWVRDLTSFNHSPLAVGHPF